MKEQEIQDQVLIEFLKLPRGTFSNWRRNKGKSYYEYIDKIADRLGVTIDYLETVSIRIENAVIIVETWNFGNSLNFRLLLALRRYEDSFLVRGHEIKTDSLTSQETELIDNYRKLTDEGRKIISANVKLLSEK